MPWDDLLALCLGRLRWPPATFWAATPREVAAALGRAPAPMSRAELDRLIAAHPD
nr:phage tail assembly chaperone [uncultured Methylobacterium sp.]